MSTLGHAYHRGAGVPNELDRAYEWWERAAGAGHRNAQLVLGRAYLDGREVTRDAERGIALLEQAAEAGELRAMRDLADLFDTGWAVIPPDLDRAHRWYERLAANGDELARGWLRYQRPYSIFSRAVTTRSLPPSWKKWAHPGSLRNMRRPQAGHNISLRH
jgi:TPR repeat protein